MRMKQLLVICVAILMMAVVAYAGSIKIEPASDAQRNIIQAALGDQYPISKIAVVKSGNHSKAYYVGAVFYAKGAGENIGIWLNYGTKDQPTCMLFSVDPTAYHFSGMKKAGTYIDRGEEAKALKKYLGK